MWVLLCCSVLELFRRSMTEPHADVANLWGRACPSTRKNGPSTTRIANTDGDDEEPERFLHHEVKALQPPQGHSRRHHDDEDDAGGELPFHPNTGGQPGPSSMVTVFTC
jgi:hypothetical protein